MNSLNILSAGAPRGAILACVEAFDADAKHRSEIEFAPAQALRAAVSNAMAEDHWPWQVLIGPDSLMDQWQRDQVVGAETRTPIGAISTAILMARSTGAGVLPPSIEDAQAVAALLESARYIVFNKASSGQFVVDLLGRFEIDAEADLRIVRTDTGGEVISTLAGLADGDGLAVGFGQMTEARRLACDEVTILGPLPAEIGKTTCYEAGLLTSAQGNARAQALIEFLASPTAATAIEAAGVHRS